MKLNIANIVYRTWVCSKNVLPFRFRASAFSPRAFSAKASGEKKVVFLISRVFFFFHYLLVRHKRRVIRPLHQIRYAIYGRVPLKQIMSSPFPRRHVTRNLLRVSSPPRYTLPLALIVRICIFIISFNDPDRRRPENTLILISPRYLYGEFRFGKRSAEKNL